MKKLESQIHPAHRLTGDAIEAMHSLMRGHYDNVDRATFLADLREKDCVIRLMDADTGELAGFSTLKVFRHFHEGRELLIAFSGDTIVRPDSWGSMELPLAFGRLMLSIRGEEPDASLYWMLISKGFRTYRFLPVFFNEFYPRHDRAIPADIQSLMHSLGRRKCPDNYRADTGVIAFDRGAQRLRSGLGEVDDARVARDPHVRFFLEKNPGHASGDELVCLAPFSPENLCPFVRRRLTVDKIQSAQPVFVACAR